MLSTNRSYNAADENEARKEYGITSKKAIRTSINELVSLLHFTELLRFVGLSRLLSPAQARKHLVDFVEVRRLCARLVDKSGLQECVLNIFEDKNAKARLPTSFGNLN